jgi:hypothetical protein
MEYSDLSPGNKHISKFRNKHILRHVWKFIKRRLTKTRFKGNAGNLQTIFDINQRIMEEPREFS